MRDAETTRMREPMPPMAGGQLPPMPKMPHKAKQGTRAGGAGLDRGVQWRANEDTGDTTGHCARCGERKPAVELRWRNDRTLFGKEVQGSWECRECHPKAGRYEVLGTRLR